jgi:hypothetical protein
MNHDIVDSLYNNESDSDPYLIFINNIYDYHIEYIDAMYTDFKNRFICTPFFLGNLRNTDLTDFIINIYQLDSKKQKNQKYHNNLYNFKSYYNSELYLSYNIIKSFLKQKTINLSLEYDNWVNFCYRYSDLHELFSNHLIY